MTRLHPTRPLRTSLKSIGHMCKIRFGQPPGVHFKVYVFDKPTPDTPRTEWSSKSAGQKNTIVARLKRPQGPTNRPTNPPRIKERRFFDGVAGDLAAGVFNPPRQLCCYERVRPRRPKQFIAAERRLKTTFVWATLIVIPDHTFSQARSLILQKNAPCPSPAYHAPYRRGTVSKNHIWAMA